MFLCLIASSTALIYLLFALFHLPLELGPVINLGLFSISNGISEGLLLGVGVILPVLSGVLLIFSLKGIGWLWRLGLPVALVIGVLVCNFVLVGMCVHAYYPVDIDPGICPDGLCYLPDSR